MELERAIEKLEKAKIFKEFADKHPDFYLVHAFTMVMSDKDVNKSQWDLGYYSEKADKIVVFNVGRKITMSPEEEVLKKKGVVKKLYLNKVKLDVEGALKIINKIKDTKYKLEDVTKSIFILQNLDGTQTYNVTLVTSHFNIINIKISAETGQVLAENKQSIMNLGKSIA